MVPRLKFCRIYDINKSYYGDSEINILETSIINSSNTNLSISC